MHVRPGSQLIPQLPLQDVSPLSAALQAPSPVGLAHAPRSFGRGLWSERQPEMDVRAGPLSPPRLSSGFGRQAFSPGAERVPGLST